VDLSTERRLMTRFNRGVFDDLITFVFLLLGHMTSIRNMI